MSLLQAVNNQVWRHSRRIKFLIDLGLWTLTLPLAFYLRVEENIFLYTDSMVILTLVALPVMAFAIREFHFYRQSWAHTDLADMRSLFVGISMTTMVLLAEVWLLQRLFPIPRSVPIIMGILALFALAGFRALVRAYHDGLAPTLKPKGDEKKVLILGAGEAGTLLVREMMRNPESPLKPVGFLDDDPHKRHVEYYGVPVMGSIQDLPRAYAESGADEVLFTIPSARPAMRREAFELAEAHGIPLRTVPGIFHTVGEVSPTQIREVMDGFITRGRPQNILIIGGAGYVGSGLIPRLLERGFHVRILDSLIYGTEPIDDFMGHPRFEVIQGDFRKVDRLVEAMQGIDTVIHLGAIVGDPACALDEGLTVEVNLIATKMVAEVAKGYGVSRFLFASTCSVYGASPDTLDENSPLNPISLYARTKIASEKVLLRMADDQFSPVILRFGTVYGFSGRTRFDLVVNLLTAKACREGTITLFGGDQWRPFVHVYDVGKAILLALEAPRNKTAARIFNVGSDEQNYTLLGAAREIQKIIPSAQIVDSGSDADARNYRVSFKRIRDELGFYPDWTLERGIRQVADAVDSGRIDDWRLAAYSNVRFMTEEGLAKIVRKEFGSVLDIMDEDGTPKPEIQPGQ